MLKFTPLAMLSIMAFMTAFNPNKDNQAIENIRLLGGLPGVPKLDCDGPYGSYYMGADRLAMSVVYLAMLYHRLWNPALALMALDIGYYGPMHTGAPLAATVAALTLF